MQTMSLVTLAVTLAAIPAGPGERAASLPELPQLHMANFFPSIRQQVQQAYNAARAHPEDAASNGKLGMVLDTYEQYESAEVCYQRALLLDPDSFRWAYYLGAAEAHQGKYEEAAARLRAALRLKPDYLPAWLSLAESLLLTGKWNESGSLYEEVVKKYPDNATAHYGQGRVYTARGDAAAAAKSYRRACELFPAYGAAHYALALEYRKLGETQKSQEQFSLYEANKTTVPPVEDPLLAAVQELNFGATMHLRRSIELEKAGKIEEATRENEEALEIDPNEVQAHINLIILYGRAGQIEKAKQHYAAAVSLSPNRADAYYNYGVLLFKQREHREAEQAFELALQINPFYAEARHNLGYLLEQQGQLDEALEQYRKAIEDRPDFRLARFHLGRILVNQKKFNEAIQEFLKTLSPEDESTPSYLYALAAAYARAGNRESALLYIRKAREQAVARGQTQLLVSIDRDLRALEQEGSQK